MLNISCLSESIRLLQRKLTACIAWFPAWFSGSGGRSTSVGYAVLFALCCWFSVTPAALALSVGPAPTVVALFSFSGSRPPNLGVHDGYLAPCPSTPNCVSSQSSDPAHQIAPFPIQPLQDGTTGEVTLDKLKEAIAALPRTRIISATDTYLYAEFTSALMGFVDDVEFYLDKAAQVIQVRSASRLGESDLGVNRQRIEALRSALTTRA